MATDKTPVQLIQDLYAAFGAAMCPASLTRAATMWCGRRLATQGMDYAGTFKGKEGVGRWFGMVAANDVIREFEPREFFGGDDHCTVIGWERTADAKTGKEFTSDWLHNFQVKNGKSHTLDRRIRQRRPAHGWRRPERQRCRLALLPRQ